MPGPYADPHMKPYPWVLPTRLPVCLAGTMQILHDFSFDQSGLMAMALTSPVASAHTAQQPHRPTQDASPSTC